MADSIFDSISSTLFGREGRFKQAPSNFNPQQLQILQQLLGMGQQGLGTDAIEGQARRGFQQNTIPLLSERFANVAGRGLSGIGSSGYQNALQGAGTELETELASLRQGNAMNLLGLGLSPQQESYYEPGRQGIAGPLSEIGGRAAAAYYTGGSSEAGNVMDLFKKLFGGSSLGEKPSGYTGMQADKTSPLSQRLGHYSGNQLLNQSAQNSIGLTPPGQFQSQFQARNMMNQGGQSTINKLLSQAWTAGLPGAAQNASRDAFLNKSYPGFQL